MKTITIKAYTRNNSQIDALEAFLKALNIKFELYKETSYNEDFVSMVKEAEQDIKDGKGKDITSDEFDDLWK